MSERDDDVGRFVSLGGNSSGRAGVSGLPSQRELLEAATEVGRRVFGAAACSVALLDEDEEHLVFAAASGEGAEHVVGLQLPVGRGIAGWVVSSGQPIAVDDVRRDPRFARDVAESTGYVPASILAVPLETQQQTLGVIEVLDRTPSPGRDDLGLLALIAHQAALGVQVSRLFHDLGRALGGAPPGPDSGDGVGAHDLGVGQAAAAPEAFTEMVAIFAELSRLGREEQAAAANLVRVFLDYARRL